MDCQAQIPLRDLSATYRDAARQDRLRDFRFLPLIKSPVLGAIREGFHCSGLNRRKKGLDTVVHPV